jgi:hypothetical protein
MAARDMNAGDPASFIAGEFTQIDYRAIVGASAQAAHTRNLASSINRWRRSGPAVEAITRPAQCRSNCDYRAH